MLIYYIPDLCINDMGDKQDLERELEELTDKFMFFNGLIDNVFIYHPLNPDFINPIIYYKQLVGVVEEIKDCITLLENQINSLN